MKKELVEHLALCGWKKVESPTFYSPEPPKYRQMRGTEYDGAGTIYVRNGKTAAVFIDQNMDQYNEYVFGDGAEEFIADMNWSWGRTTADRIS